MPNQPENGKYNLISVCFNKISKMFLCVHVLNAGKTNNHADISIARTNAARMNCADILIGSK